MKKNRPAHYPPKPETLGELMNDQELKQRERRVRRVLTLEELIRLNQRVDEFNDGRHPPGSRLEVGLDPPALGRFLQLLMEDALRQRDYRRRGRPEEIRRRLRESQENMRQLQALHAKQLRESQENVRRLQTLIEEIAAIVSQTYAELGDGAPLADDEALHLVRERLLDDDERMIDGQRTRGVALVQAWRRREKRDVH